MAPSFVGTREQAATYRVLEASRQHRQLARHDGRGQGACRTAPQACTCTKSDVAAGIEEAEAQRAPIGAPVAWRQRCTSWHTFFS
ncbi:hypothetical protein NDU88_004867 [Pleurodeles waltl]|uniref:Uncharacterized protein n=1 Tax=Pleurodeles waltl TaxID=8319 RepID=A0AAV7MYS5_PLEWA|nr:hypothetical protein NDU88_004867 [Pleurodeles waltl]